jgi:hypothetical protein
MQVNQWLESERELHGGLMRPGGWHRLWVPFSALYLLGVIAFVIIAFPNPEGMPHSRSLYCQLSPEFQKRISANENSKRIPGEKEARIEEAHGRGLIQEVEMPNGHELLHRRRARSS